MHYAQLFSTYARHYEKPMHCGYTINKLPTAIDSYFNLEQELSEIVEKIGKKRERPVLMKNMKLLQR